MGVAEEAIHVLLVEMEILGRARDDYASVISNRKWP